MAGKYWTAAWNFAVGCQACSRACANCWAPLQVARWAEREKRVAPTVSQGRWTGRVALLEDRLDLPLHWRTPRVVAVNWLGDLFHPFVEDETILRAWDVMSSCPQHASNPAAAAGRH